MTHLHLAVALESAGWHPAAWRSPDARPDALFTADHWAGLVAEAERARLDFVTFEDSLGLQSSRPDGADERTDQVRGRLDAVLLAARLAPLTTRIGLVPTTSTTHSEPFHVAIGIATLDHVSRGRAGWRPRISAGAAQARHFGHREFPEHTTGVRTDPAALAGHVAELFAEATDVVEVVRRLWDSWEDDAEIRDVATGRFVDRDKLHYVDFHGAYFSVKGPSITPRPPQGQPLVTALAHDVLPYEFAATSADLVYVTPRSREHATTIVGRVRRAEAVTGRTEPLKIFADLVVFLDEATSTARSRKAELDDLDGAAFTSDAYVFTGTPGDLADLLLDWRSAGLDGFRLRPGALPHDLAGVARRLVPALRDRGVFREEYGASTLRGLLGLTRPANRYGSVR
jgi:alkanesulfonate monooxygenase SsuD/methylene tetrahydromethanopterin reductase-like flavin-dependent oxidoreductase (luciferase family)